MTTALATTEQNPLARPEDNYRLSTDVAGICKQAVLKTASNIKGKKYVRVEGWQTIATAHGCLPSIRSVETTEDGIRAVAELRRIDSGGILAEAEGFVGNDESTWAGRPMFARRAMAQTRAISRVCRSAFAHVVVLMDAGLSTTPAEEMEGAMDAEVSETPSRASRKSTARKPASKPDAPEASGHGITGEEHVDCRVLRTSVKQGASGERYGVLVEFLGERKGEHWLNTFSKTIYANAEAEKGNVCIATISPGKNPQFLDVKAMQFPAPTATAEQPSAEEPNIEW